MAKGDYYFPLFYQRFYSSTQGWTEEQEGAYLRLLTYQFDKGSIPNDIKIIKKISQKAAKNWSFFQSKFVQNSEGNLINPVMDEIRQKIQEKKDKNLRNGKLGGSPKTERLLKKDESENRTVIENETERVTQTKPIPLTNNQIIERESKKFVENITYTIEHCLVVAMSDGRWVKANHTNEKELKEFNSLLEKRGIYEKNPLDYKNHFANWKNTGKKELKDEPETNPNYRLKKLA
jgi:uncharacterized protein YdaU (DUF1376 family)